MQGTTLREIWKMTYNKMDKVYTILTKVCDSMVNEMFVPAGMDVGSIGLFISRKRNAYGYCYIEENWKVNENGLREIGLTPEGLMRGEQGVCTTLAHELVHAYNAVHGIKDVSGQRHNKKFKDGCDRIGLGCQIRSKTIGWGTDPSFNDEKCLETFERVLGVLEDEERNLLNNLASVLDIEKPKAKSRNLSVFICPRCGAKARGKPSLNLVCGDCMESMECQD